VEASPGGGKASELARLTAELEQERSQLAMLEEETGVLREQAAAAAGAGEEARRLTAELQQERANNSMLQQQVEAEKGQLGRVTEEAAALRQQLQLQQQQVDTHKDRNKLQTQQQEQLQTQQQLLQLQQQQLQTQKEQLAEKLAAVSQLSGKLEAKRSDVARLERQIQLLKEQLADSQNQLVAAKAATDSALGDQAALHRLKVTEQETALSALRDELQQAKENSDRLLQKQQQADASAWTPGGKPAKLPLTFHPTVHGKNIRLTNGGTRAQNVNPDNRYGILFSSRPVCVNERMTLRVADVDNSGWITAAWLGFTSVDPSTQAGGDLPRYAHEFRNQPGYWVGLLPLRYARCGCVFYFYVSADGDVHCGVNNGEEEILTRGVDTSQPLWCIVDIGDGGSAVEIVREG